MFLLLRNIVFDLIFLASMTFPVIQSSCDLSSHNCSQLNGRPIEVYLLQNGINRADINFDEPDTQATYVWTLTHFNRPDLGPSDDITSNSQMYNSTSDILSLQPTVDNQGLYYCRTTGGQQCPIDYCIRLISSPNITMFNATYFEETNSTVFTLEIKYNNDDNVVTCLPISRIEIKKRDSSTNFATCFNQNLSSCVPEYTNSYEPVESGFQYNLSVNAPFATSDAFTLAVVGSSVATPNGTTSTTVILSTTTFSTSANITVITTPSATSSVIMMSSQDLLSSSFMPTMSNPTVIPSSTLEISASMEIPPSMSPTYSTESPQNVHIILPTIGSIAGILIILVILVIIFTVILRCHPKMSNKRGSYKPTDGDDNTINTNGVTEPTFELSPQGFSKEERV